MRIHYWGSAFTLVPENTFELAFIKQFTDVVITSKINEEDLMQCSIEFATKAYKQVEKKALEDKKKKDKAFKKRILQAAKKCTKRKPKIERAS